MKKIVGLLFVICLTISLSAQKDLSNYGEVTPVKSSLNIDGTQIIYALPKNVIRVEFTIQKKETISGPFAKYAAKYLNINEGVIGVNTIFYSIVDAKFFRYSVVDTSKYFSIGKVNPFNIPEIRMNDDGVILSCNSNSDVSGYQSNTAPEVVIEPEFNEKPFLDFGVNSFLIEKIEKQFKTVKTDSGEIKIPSTEKKLVPITDEQNAEKAAAFIRKLRKRRFKLLVGYEGEVNEVDGEAMKTMIAELKQLEKSYLELFIGKEQTIEHKYYLDFEPETNEMDEQDILCYFSSQKGISLNKTDIRRGDFEPIIIKSELLVNSPKPQLKLIDNSGKAPTPVKYGLYYTIPGRVKLTVKTKDAILAQQQFQIAQKGHVVPLPIDYLIDRKFAIDFYPEIGAIKRIKHNID